MELFAEMGRWIRENEALLSGIAALIVVAGVILSPLGLGLRRILGRVSPAGAQTGEQSSAVAAEHTAEPAARQADNLAAGPSIALLPFDNLSDDSEQAFLADGMTEDIITGLAATPRLTVIARNSTFAYKGQSPDIREVGRNLGVRYVLEGSVRRVADKIRVTVQLIEAASGNHLWAQKYDRPYAEIFVVQDEVVSDIAGALSLQITAAEVTRARTVPPDNLDAWELVTQALHSHFRHAPAQHGSLDVLDALQRAVALDESYGYARAAYAWMLASAAINGWADEPMAALAQANGELHTALQLDTSDALSQYYIGAAYLYLGKWEKSVRTLQHSLSQNPHQPDALVHLGLSHAYSQNFEEAYACFDNAARMGSNESHEGFYAWYRGIALSLEDRHEEAISFIAPVILNFPFYQTPKIVAGVCFELTGQTQKAKESIERAYAAEPSLNADGIALNIGAHFNPEKGRERIDVFRKYWPGPTDSESATI